MKGTDRGGGSGRPVASDKIMSMSDAAALVPDGARIALGGFAVYQHPMAFVRELVRQGRRGLTVVGVVNGNEADLLAGAGCLARIETSYVGLEKYGLAPNFRRAVEAGELEVVDYPELLAWDRFRASEANHTFLQASFLGGTDIVARNPGIVPFDCPLTGRRLWAVPPADAEIAVVHAPLADARGNALYPERRLLPQSLDITLARSCDTVIVTAERIADEDEIRRNAPLNVIPSYRVRAVVEAPWGAHPCPVLGFSKIDDRAFREHAAAGADEESFAAWLEETVFGVDGHRGYLERIGPGRLLALRTAASLR